MLETLANCTGVLEKAVQCSHGVQSRIYVSLAGWNVEVIAPSVHYAEMCKRALSGVLKTKPEVIDFERKKQADAEARIKTIEESLSSL